MAAFSSNQHFGVISFSRLATLNPAVANKLAAGIGVREKRWQHLWVCRELCIIQSIISMQQPLKVSLLSNNLKKYLSGEKLQEKSWNVPPQSFTHMVHNVIENATISISSPGKGVFTKHLLAYSNIHEC